VYNSIAGEAGGITGRMESRVPTESETRICMYHWLKKNLQIPPQTFSPGFSSNELTLSPFMPIIATVSKLLISKIRSRFKKVKKCLNVQNFRSPKLVYNNLISQGIHLF
jgi:hypothetical protein